MARYDLPQYQSVYRDPQSVAINKELRDRYTAAFLADDELTAAVDAMNAADFEGDQQLKNQLATQYNAKLAERARRGDYETMGTSVMRDARKFTQGYAPIKQNYDAVQAYASELKKRLGEGKISEEQYSHAMGLSTQGYNGLVQKADGSIDESSYFNGTRIVNYQDISAMIDERMEAVSAEEGGRSVRRVGQGPDAMYEHQIGEEWKIISPERVEAVVADVMSNPNVQAYLNQIGDIRSYNVSDKDIKSSLSMSLYGNPDDPEDGGLKGELAKLVASGKTDKKTVATMEALQEEIRRMEELLPGEGIEDSEELVLKRKQALKNERIQEEIMRKTGVARSTHMMHNVWTEDLQEYDQMSLARYKQYLADYVPTVYEDTGMTEINSPSGISTKSVTTYIDKHNDMMQAVLDDATAFAVQEGYIETGEDGVPVRKLTIDDIKNGNVPEGMEGLVDSYRNKIYALETQKIIAEKRLEKARTDMGYSIDTDKEAEEKFLNNSFSYTVGKGSITGQQMLDTINKLYGREMDYETALSTLNQLQKIANTYDPTAINLTEQGKAEQARAKQAFDEVQRFSNMLKEDHNVSGWFGSTLSKRERLIDNMLDFKNQYIQKRDNEVDAYLKKNSKLQTGGMTSSTMPGLDNRQVIANTKAVKNHFEKKLLNPNFKIFYNGQKQSDGTGTAAQLVEDLDWDNEAVTVSQVTFDTTPYLGEPTLQFKVKGKKDGKDVTTVVKVPYSNMQQAGMDQYFNHPSYRMALEVNMARHSNLPETNIGFFNENGVQTGGLKWTFSTGKSSGDVITYIDIGDPNNPDDDVKRSITAQDAARFIDNAGREDTRQYLPSGEINPNFGKPMHVFRTIK